MYRVARNPAAGARGPAGAVYWLYYLRRLPPEQANDWPRRTLDRPTYTAPAGPRAPAAGLRATRYIRLLDKKRLLDKPGD